MARPGAVIAGRHVPPLAVVALLVGHLALSVAPALLAIRNDFANYYVPARVVRSGGSLDRVYERDWFQAQARRAGIQRLGGFVPYPPPNALLLVALAGLPPGSAKAVWTALLAVALLLAFLVLRPLVSVSAWLLALVFLLPTSSLANALLYGQPYPLLLLLLCLSLGALLRGRPFLSGLLLSPVLVLKLYGAAFLLHFLWTRRWRAAAGAVTGAALLAALSLGVLGVAVHAAYLREVLPASLAGESQDPYATSWGSLTTLSHRLFQREPELNPSPVADRPALARALARGLPAAALLLGVASCAAGADPRRLRREWAALGLGSLAASPLPASFHFILLVLPVALLLPEVERRALRVALLGLLAFATSPAPHYFAPLASGWGNLLAHPRLAANLALFAVAAAPLLSRRRVLLALAGGLLAAFTTPGQPPEEPWTRVAGAHGFVQGEPVACEGGLAWVTVKGEHLVVRAPGGRVLESEGDVVFPRCAGGRLTTLSAIEAVDLEDGDSLADGRVAVFADRGARALEERDTTGIARVLVRGLVRWPRLSPDGAWVVYQAWERGSWDVRAVERATRRVVSVASGPANEVEPSWLPGGDGIVFASDGRRGLGFTALYSVPFRP